MLKMQGHPLAPQQRMSPRPSSLAGGLHESGSHVSGIAAPRLHPLDAEDQPLRSGLLSLVEPGGSRRGGFLGGKSYKNMVEGISTPMVSASVDHF